MEENLPASVLWNASFEAGRISRSNSKPGDDFIRLKDENGMSCRKWWAQCILQRFHRMEKRVTCEREYRWHYQILGHLISGKLVLVNLSYHWTHRVG